MADIVIRHSSGWGECDDCGSYDWEAVTVERDGQKLFFHAGDGHLGGGTWYDWREPVRAILTALGHSVEFIDESGDE